MFARCGCGCRSVLSRAIHRLANEQLLKVKAAQDARANSHRPTDNFIKGDRVKVSMEHRSQTAYLHTCIHSLAGAKKLRGKFVLLLLLSEKVAHALAAGRGGPVEDCAAGPANALPTSRTLAARLRGDLTGGLGVFPGVGAK